MPKVYIGVGSNINPGENVRKALKLLACEVTVVAVSTIYCTEPEGRPEQPPFYNGVVEITTDKSPHDLKRSVLQPIEKQLGRVRGEDKYAPRTIDLDILVYDDVILNNDEIVIPDPQIPERVFLAVPLYEIAPDMVLPDTGVPIADITAAFRDHNMKPLIEYTELLRKDLTDEL